MQIIEAKWEAKGCRFAIVASRFNQHITDRLLEGAQGTLLKSGVASDDITVVFAAGSFEIPILVQHFAASKKFDAVIALGCILRGETSHYDVLCQSTTQALHQISLTTNIPVTCGIVMAETADQAIERAGGKMGNRGEEAARAAVETVNVLKRIG